MDIEWPKSAPLLLMDVAQRAYLGIISGQATPFQTKMSDRLKCPLPGDLVCSVSGLERGDADAIGILEDRLYDMESSRPPDQQGWDWWLWRIRPLDGRDAINWGNAEFIVVWTKAVEREVLEYAVRGAELSEAPWRKRYEAYRASQMKAAMEHWRARQEVRGGVSEPGRE